MADIQPEDFLSEKDLERYNNGGCTYELVVEGRYCRHKRVEGSPWRYCSRHTKTLDDWIRPTIKGDYDAYNWHMGGIETIAPEFFEREKNYYEFIKAFILKVRGE
jgi:hypothetical protein